MIPRLLLVTFCTLPLCISAEPKKKSSGALMKFLPNGTSLQNVAVPTFDEKGQQTSLLKADRVTVVNKNKGIVDIFKAKVEITDETDPLFIHMEKGRYFRPKNLITSNHPVKIFKSNLDVVGTGALFDFGTHEVFIKGPSKTTYLEETVAAQLLQNISLLMAVPPHLSVELSDQEKLELAALESAASNTVETIEKETAAKVEEVKTVSTKSDTSDQNLVEFAKKAGEKIEINEPSTEQEAPTEEKISPDALVITNDGGTYFDAENNVLVFLNNVEAENPDMHLTCSKDLKIFMEPKNKEEAKDADGIGGMGSLDMKELLATGDVKITYKTNGNKPPLIATGGSAFYKMTEEEVLIKGGYPKVQQGKGYYVAKELGMWVKLSRKGAVWSKGKQQLVYIPEK